MVQERRAELTRLVRKYGDDVEGLDEVAAVLAWGQRAAARLTALEGDDDRIGLLAARRDELVAELARTAGQLSAARVAAAERFAAEVSGELAALAMASARRRGRRQPARRWTSTGSAVDGRTLAFGPHGVDEVEMLLRPHAGAPARALQKGASGGELSRVMLAVEVVLAGTDPVPTLVFDEVDAGVGGKAAVEVGRRLAALARGAQVAGRHPPAPGGRVRRPAPGGRARPRTAP